MNTMVRSYQILEHQDIPADEKKARESNFLRLIHQNLATLNEYIVQNLENQVQIFFNSFLL